MTRRRDALTTFGQESVRAEDQAGHGFQITAEQARLARRWAARQCEQRGLGREDLDDVEAVLGVQA